MKNASTKLAIHAAQVKAMAKMIESMANDMLMAAEAGDADWGDVGDAAGMEEALTDSLLGHFCKADGSEEDAKKLIQKEIDRINN